MKEEVLQEKFVEILFDEVDSAKKAETWREIALDKELAADFELSKLSLDLFEKASEIDAPSENYWTHFERDLQQSIRAEACLIKAEQPEKVSFIQSLKGFFTASIRIPAPVLALSLVLLGVAGFYAVRPSAMQTGSNLQIESVHPLARPNNVLPENSMSQAPVIIEKIVEKPVIREKIVIQKVYVKEVTSEKEAIKETRIGNQIAKREPKTRREPENPTLNLAAFTPTEKLDVKVIKEVSDAK